MKRVLSSLSVLALTQLLLWALARAALGMTFGALLSQGSLAGVIGGFGFLIGILILLLARFMELPEIHQTGTSQSVLSLLFPGASICLLVIMIYMAREIREITLVTVLFGCVLVVANGAIFYLLRMMKLQAREERERLLLNRQMELQTESILALEKSYRSQRQATHEFRSQLQTIHDLLAGGQPDRALDYIHELRGMQTSRGLAVNTHHPIFDAILNQKYQAARELDIDIRLQVNDLSPVKLGTDAMVVLFSNLLDNAIEACQKLPQGRIIQCSILASDSLYLSIANTSPPVTITGGHIPTTKEPRQEHGFGLVSVRRILENLGAEYTFHYADGWFEFAAEIQL